MAFKFWCTVWATALTVLLLTPVPTLDVGSNRLTYNTETAQ